MTLVFEDGSTTSGGVRCGNPVSAYGFLRASEGSAAFNACTSFFNSQVASFFFERGGRDVCPDLITEARSRKYHGNVTPPRVRATIRGEHFGRAIVRRINTISGDRCDRALAKVFAPLLAPIDDRNRIVQPWPPA